MAHADSHTQGDIKEEIKYLSTFKEKGISYLDNLSEKKLSNMLKYSNQAYYEGSNENNIILTDDEYDILREYTIKLYPKNKIALEGHINCIISDKKKTELPCNMPSMNKYKDKKTINNWLSKYSNNNKVISAKLDGVSGLYCYKKSDYDKNVFELKLYTRGNGTIGQDITSLIKYLKLPELTNYGIIIRGEFIIKKEIFNKKYSNIAANPRNFVAGIINSKKIDTEKLKDIDFIAYEIVNPNVKPVNQMKALKRLKFNTVINQIVEHKDITTENLSKILVSYREKYDYEIDGIICTDNEIYSRINGNPEHSFAFKMILSEQIAETTVIDVIWNPSKDGYLKPVVQVQPVNLSGAEINYVTGVNAKKILEEGIGFGAKILLLRSGDVIPDIHKVLIPASKPILPKLPENAYKWNETHVDFVLIDLNNKDVKSKIITKFFKTLNVDGLGEGNIKRLIDTGYDSISEILFMSYNNLLSIEGFKEKLATKIYKNIHNAIDKATLSELMVATNIFGRGFGLQRINIILENYNDVFNTNISINDKIEKLITIEGIAQKTAEYFVSKIEEFIEWINETKLQHKFIEFEMYETNSKLDSHNEKHPLSNINWVMSGVRHKELIKKLTEIGTKQNSNVNKSTNILLVDSLDSNSSKTIKAKELNIPIMTYDDFIKKYTLNL